VNNIRVSVVIPCYNAGDLILRAVRSVLIQGDHVEQVIVVDDCSNESSTLEALDQLVELSAKLLVIRGVHQVGAAAARNKGIREATGNLIAFLDADDEWLPEKFTVQLERVSDWYDAYGDAWFSASDALLRGDSGSTPANGDAVDFSKGVAHFLLVGNGTLQTSTLIAPTALLQTHEFNESLHRHQDWDLLIRLEEAGAANCYVKTMLSIYDVATDRSRISISRNGLQNTLEWFDHIKTVVPPEYLQIYFFSHALNRISARQPLHFIVGVIRVIQLNPINGCKLLASAAQRVFNKYVLLQGRRG
jgi:glycosyltransferase involved in cell wall biosynthesis